jgi:hypothetical protein
MGGEGVRETLKTALTEEVIGILLRGSLEVEDLEEKMGV